MSSWHRSRRSGVPLPRPTTWTGPHGPSDIWDHHGRDGAVNWAQLRHQTFGQGHGEAFLQWREDPRLASLQLAKDSCNFPAYVQQRHLEWEQHLLDHVCAQEEADALVGVEGGSPDGPGSHTLSTSWGGPGCCGGPRGPVEFADPNDDKDEPLLGRGVFPASGDRGQNDLAQLTDCPPIFLL